MILKLKISPISKPRMTQRDKWKRRKCVVEYWHYRDAIKANGVTLPDGNFHAIFFLPMPKSWGRAKRDLMRGRPHQQKPDKDNLEKGLLDAVFGEDRHVWDSRTTKIWADEGAIWITTIQEFQLPV